MGYLAWRYRNSVMHHLEHIFIHASGLSLKPILKICFDDRWVAAVEKGRLEGAPPDHMAVVLTTYMVPYLLISLSEQQKSLTRFAIETGNEAEAIAGNFFSMIRQTRKIAGDEAADDLYLRFLGALHGHDDLDAYVAEKLKLRSDA